MQVVRPNKNKVIFYDLDILDDRFEAIPDRKFFSWDKDGDIYVTGPISKLARKVKIQGFKAGKETFVKTT